MGSYLSTNRSSNDDSQLPNSTGAYKYPPKNGGAYFSNHFIMGGEKFDTPQPEAFLFGENSDLNFLDTKPCPFPYPPPQATEPTKTLRSLINIRRDSVHLSLVPGQKKLPIPPTIDSDTDEYQHQSIIDESVKIWNMHKDRKFNIQFTFDADVRVAITIYYMCTEEITSSGVNYHILPNGFMSDTFYYKRGVHQVFLQPSHIFQPGNYKNEELLFHVNEENNTILPVVIHCLALDGESPKQSHTTIASIERASDGSYVLKNIKQKLFVDGLSYLLQEIYGLENKAADLPNKPFDEDLDDCGADCVVCMCDLRDTIILPCRHLCLCYACAESLRYQASNCPICRAPFIALLQIRAVQKMSHATHPALAGTEPTTQEGVPPGYVSVSLVDALNGPINKDNPNGAYGVTGMIMNSEDVTMTTSNTKSKKSRKQRRGSKEGMYVDIFFVKLRNFNFMKEMNLLLQHVQTSFFLNILIAGVYIFLDFPKEKCFNFTIIFSGNKSSGSNAGGGPRQSSSTSSQLSQMTGTNSLTEEQEQQPGSSSLRNQNILEESQNITSNNGGTIPTSSASLTTTQLQTTTSKVKSAETNVKVSLQIVNEVENVHNVSNNSNTRKSNESLDIVDEELAKMAVAESLTDLPLEIDR